MCDQPNTLTLLEDWQARRAQLAREPGPVGQHADALLRVLDFLIQHYGDSPEAARPARGPSDTAIFFDERATVVLSHVWEGRVGGAQTAIQAANRVNSITHRLAQHATASFDDDPLDRSLQYQVPEPLRDPRRRFCVCFGSFLRLMVRLGHKPHKFIYSGLVYRSPLLSREVLQYLSDRLNDRLLMDVDAVDLLALCDNRDASTLAFLAWRRRLESGGRDPVTDRIEELFLARWGDQEGASCKRQLDAVRNQLASSVAVIRLRAIRLIEKFGVLDDVGLLLDLLKLTREEEKGVMPPDTLASGQRLLPLPGLEEEDCDERSVIVHAIEALSRRVASD